MQNPLVSVHMITYNQERFIRRAIDSVLAQKTDFPFELVIGEDCSTDGTRQIVRDYQQKHPEKIRVVTSERNVGPKKNFVRTIEACRGKYIAFCEGDDFWHCPDKLQIQADYLEKHPGCGLVYSEHDRFFAEKGKTIRNFYQTVGQEPPACLNVFEGWGPYHILTCTVMARLDMVQSIVRNPFPYQDERHIGGLDIPLFIEIAMRASVFYIRQSLATYTVQAESASNTRNFQKKARFVKCNVETYLYLAEKYGRKGDSEHLYRDWLRACLWAAFWDRDKPLAEQARQKGALDSWKARLLYIGAVRPELHLPLRGLITLFLRWKNRIAGRMDRYFSD